LIRKPKNARSKRAAKAREPKIVEGSKTAIFVKGKQTSQNVNLALSELVSDSSSEFEKKRRKKENPD
jgi:hypothetical protein